MKRLILIPLSIVFSLGLMAQARDSATPHLEKHAKTTQLVVDGKPFLILGAELLNSSSSSLDYMRPIWPRLAAIPLNTVLTPLSWELIEPREGEFKFGLLDGLIADARQNNLHIIFLWLASWKNGTSSYAPIWVKQNPERFPRVVKKGDNLVEVLTPLGQESMQADARAFAAVMRHIREVDGETHTVLMMQVENEVGVLGDSRDRSPAADRAYGEPVPKQLTAYIEQHRDALIPEFRRVWEDAGAKDFGTWQEVFGPGAETDKIFMAWNYGRYIQSVAAAGKAQYPLPMYVNTWLAEPGAQPGQYPSGGPLPEVMDVWRAAGDAIDIYAPDIYQPDFAGWCDRYNRAGNPLFIPETQAARTNQADVFYAIGRRETIGFSPFGIDGFVDQDRDVLMDPENSLGKSYSVLLKLAPVILEHEGKGEMTGFLLDKHHPQSQVELNGYRLDISLDQIFETEAEAGYGLIISIGPNEFLGAGSGFRVSFGPVAPGPARVGISSIDEGTFSGGFWIPGRRLNGDENDQGRRWRFPPKRIGIQKAVVYRYEEGGRQ